MKTLSIEELQALFGGEDPKYNKCDELQKKLADYEETGSYLDEEFYDWWAIAFEECANGTN